MSLQSNLPLDKLIAALEQCIPEGMAQANTVGVSVALVHSTEGESDPVVWQRGFGLKDAESGEPVTPETVFQAASLSKPAFAYTVLVASRDGLLDLDTPLSAYLPEPYIAGDPRLHQITARHVLSHTPGFPNWRPKEQPLRIHFSAGERFAYSGEGHVYLQRVIEHLSGQPLDAWMRSRLLGPLGMQRSSYVWVDTYETEAARGHDEEGKPTEMRRMRGPNAAYSLYTTPSEYARFVGALLQPSDGSLYLTVDEVTGILAPQVPVNDGGLDAERPTSEVRTSERVSWGLGWGLQHAPGIEAFWHWGDNGDYQAFVMGSRQLGRGMVCMANCKSGRQLWADLFGLAFGADLPAVAWLYSLYGESSGNGT
jgi:CubicO group peptidase (beta-lactamase class C family)